MKQLHAGQARGVVLDASIKQNLTSLSTN